MIVYLVLYKRIYLSSLVSPIKSDVLSLHNHPKPGQTCRRFTLTNVSLLTWTHQAHLEPMEVSIKEMETTTFSCQVAWVHITHFAHVSLPLPICNSVFPGFFKFGLMFDSPSDLFISSPRPDG